ncbi:MAG: C1 family peptidase [Candidatus Omnitrophota bacterium]
MSVKKTLLGLLFAAILVSFMVMPSLQGIQKLSKDLNADLTADPIQFSPDDTMKDLQVKIQRMRAQIRQEGGTYDVGINPSMQYPLEQLCGLKPELSGETEFSQEEEIPMAMGFRSNPSPLAASYNGYCSPIKNQGSCGSCWAFATCGAAEAAYYKRYGTWYDFSEQYLLDCNASGYSCAGGWFSFDTFGAGVPRESCYYGYDGRKYSCESNYCTTKYTISGFNALCGNTVCSPATIKSAITTYGAVACAVYANSNFQAYTSGCFNGKATGTVNHAVVLCGYNDATPCATGAWKLKNSWGTGWGQAGVMWINYGSQSVGYKATYCWK